MVSTSVSAKRRDLLLEGRQYTAINQPILAFIAVVEKKRPLVVRLLGGLAITVMTLYCSPRGRTGKGRGPEGSGLYPELAAYRISEGCSPNVKAEVGRLVGLLPIEQARAELARKGQEQDEKAVRRIAC